MRDQSSGTGDQPVYPYIGETGSSPTRRTRALLTLVVLLFGTVAFVSVVAVRTFRHERWVHPEVQGFVRDASGKGIADVTVRIERSEYTDKSTMTDNEGKFTFDAISATVYIFPGDGLETTILSFTRDGYAPHQTKLGISNGQLYDMQRVPKRDIEVRLEPDVTSK